MELTTSENKEENHLIFKSNSPEKIFLDTELGLDIPEGLELVVSSNVNICENCSCTKTNEKTRNCDLFTSRIEISTTMSDLISSN